MKKTSLQTFFVKTAISTLCATLVFPAKLIAATSASEASTIANVPSLFDAGRVSKRVGEQPSAPLAAAPVANKLNQVKQPETTEQKIHLKLTKVILEGNTVFTHAQIASIYQAKINKTISLYELQMTVQAITRKYREAGYILSRAILPAQEIKNGVVRIQIIEGYIHNVNIAGNPGALANLLKSYGALIKAMRPLQMSVLEHFMLLANDLPGVKVSAVLVPAKKTPAAADLTLTVERKRANFSASYDNFGTRYIGPNQVTLTGNAYSLTTPGSNDMLRGVVTSNTKELHYAEYMHAQPLGSRGLNLTFDANYTQTRPDFTLQPLDIVGRSATAFVDLSYPLIRSRNDNFYLHSMATYENVTSLILSTPFYQDRIRSLTVGGFYNNLDRWRGLNTISLDLEHGFSILGAHDHVNQSRPNGQTIYSKVNWAVSRLQGLSARWSLLGALHGQYTHDPLLATEQFGFGGTDYGRGYDPSEIVGDRGVAGKLELRLDTAPGLKVLQTVQYYAFYDSGIIWNVDNINSPDRQTAMSAGIGARMNFLPQVSGNFYIAKPLTLPVATQQILGRNAKAPRAFFQLVLQM